MKLYTLLFSVLLSTFAVAQETETAEINWVTMEEAYTLSQENPGKPILVDLYTDWCGWCKRMDKDTYSNAEIIQFINDNFYAVKFDAEQKEDVTVLNNTFKFVAQGKKGYHELAAAMMDGKMSYPTTVFLDENFQLIQPVPGYMDAKSIEPILAFFGTGAYKNGNWEAFQKSFKSNL